MPSPIRPLSLSKGGIWKQTGTEGDLYVKIKDRDGIDVSTSQGTPKTQQPTEAEREHGTDSSSEPTKQKRINLDTLISDIWPPDTLENKFLLF